MPYPPSGTSTPFSVNGRDYSPPARPVVVICIDGCADQYLDVSLARGRMPNVGQMTANGYRGLVRGALPSYTNVNNACMVTGAPPSVTGIGGNFFLDPSTGEEVMMNSPRYLRCGTILAAAADAGRRVAMVTAKDKLREILSHGLNGIGFSAEKADQAREDAHGIADVERLVGEPTPKIYSAEASVFVLRAGVALIRGGLTDFLYLSTTDYMQHKFDPYAEASLQFYESLDREVGRLLELGALVVLTADHGMNAKNGPGGGPNVLYLQSMLTAQFGADIRVILPITDPYVVHHGALGSLAMVHLADGVAAGKVQSWLMAQPGITEVHDRQTAAVKMELPEDRIGDLVVLSGRDVVLGRTPDYHDLSLLEGGLRSHGGRYEQMVPLLVSEPLNDIHAAKAAADPRNFDAFDFACNGVG